ncbi:hypothetical protein ABNO07_003549 [Salmonella enterica subsp. enterica serovar Bareilly]
MKLTKLIIAAAIVASFGANAGSFDDAANSRNKAQEMAEHFSEHGQFKAQMSSVRAFNKADSMMTGTSMRDQISAQQATAMNAAAQKAAVDKSLAARAPSTPAAEVSQPSTPAATTPDAPAAVTAAKPNETANSSINVDAASLGNQQVNVTKDGVTQTVAASSLPAGTQVSVPMDSAFSRPARTGNGDRSHSNSHSEHGTGNGGSNAQNSRSAGGLADSHVGGGRSGGGFHY